MSLFDDESDDDTLDPDVAMAIATVDDDSTAFMSVIK